VVEYFAHEVAVMYLGRIVERGTVEEVMHAPRHPYTRALLSACRWWMMPRAGKSSVWQGICPRRQTAVRLPLPPALPAGHGRMPANLPGRDRLQRNATVPVCYLYSEK